jgi:hypothetical protein
MTQREGQAQKNLIRAQKMLEMSNVYIYKSKDAGLTEQKSSIATAHGDGSQCIHY